MAQSSGIVVAADKVDSRMQWLRVLVFVLIALTESLRAQSNPVPLVNQPLVPTAAQPGGPGFTLTVNGTGFVSGSVVNWNGSARPTQFVSTSRLRASIAAADVAKVSTASITVKNPSTGALSNTVYFQVTVPSTAVSFNRSDFPTGAGAQGVVAADFNRDGKLDLALSVVPSGSPQVLILPGLGDGTFGSPVSTLSAGESFPLVTDFNGDGNLDLAVANNCNCIQGFTTWLGNGDGTFGAPLTASTTYQSNGLMAAGDFNGDGKVDVAVTTAHAVSVFLGKGDGTFEPEQLYPTTWTIRPIVTADVNGDGRLDLIVGGSNTSGAGVLLAYLGNGDGSFQPPQLTDIEPPNAILAADLNGDGKLDIVSSTPGTDISVLLGQGDGTFQQPTYYATGSVPVWLADGDFNGDGHLDIATADQGSDTVSLLLGNGDGTFSLEGSVAVGLNPNVIAAGDFNNDGRLDLAVGNFLSPIFTILSQEVEADLTPPVITVSASPAVLWPPNGKVVPVTISGSITDAGSGVNTGTAVYAIVDEYGEVQPSGTIAVDSLGNYVFTVSLKASRHGNDQDGRQYRVTVSAKDNAGNLGSSSAVVIVPHAQGQ